MKRVRAHEENLKRTCLLKLWLALDWASRYLTGFDTTALKQAINAAEARPVRGVQLPARPVVTDEEADHA
jgi:hypothetical protein